MMILIASYCANFMGRVWMLYLILCPPHNTVPISPDSLHSTPPCPTVVCCCVP